MTYADLHYDKLLEGVSEIAEQIFNRLESGRSKEDDTEIVIAAREDVGSGIIVYGYYLASWEEKCIFWLDEMEFDEVTGGSRICVSDAHLGILVYFLHTDGNSCSLGKHIEQLFWYVMIPLK